MNKGKVVLVDIDEPTEGMQVVINTQSYGYVVATILAKNRWNSDKIKVFYLNSVAYRTKDELKKLAVEYGWTKDELKFDDLGTPPDPFRQAINSAIDDAYLPEGLKKRKVPVRVEDWPLTVSRIGNEVEFDILFGHPGSEMVALIAPPSDQTWKDIFERFSLSGYYSLGGYLEKYYEAPKMKMQ